MSATAARLPRARDKSISLGLRAQGSGHGAQGSATTCGTVPRAFCRPLQLESESFASRLRGRIPVPLRLRVESAIRERILERLRQSCGNRVLSPVHSLPRDCLELRRTLAEAEKRGRTVRRPGNRGSACRYRSKAQRTAARQLDLYTIHSRNSPPVL